MHNGDDTAYYLSQGYDVVAIDASPYLVREAEKQFRSDIEKGRLQILNIGIAEEEGELEFYLNKKNSVWNSFDKNIGSREGADVEVIKVKTKSIAQIIKEKGLPYYMKIDIEGNDITCLQSLQHYHQKPKYISVEVNGIGLILKLHELGYQRFKIIDQESLLPFELPAIKEYKAFNRHKSFKLSRNFFVRATRKLFGKYIHRYYENQYRHFFNYDHPYGSSGPFGDNLPRNWLSFEEALHVYLHYKHLHQHSKWNLGYNYWIDIHATV